MTKNTHLYKIQCVINKKKQNIYYRDLTAIEYLFISNIKNEAFKEDLAGRTAIFDCDPDKIPFSKRMIIGRDCLDRVKQLLSSNQLFEITINELREKIKRDDFMIAIKYILMYLPGQSYTDLLKLNIIDILELVCLCEQIYNKPLFEFGQKKHGLVNTKNLLDDGKSLQDKMNALNKFVGNPR